MEKKRQIIFYAPLGKDTPPERIGGAEVGCLKTKKIYEEAGYDVIVIDKPAMSRGKFRYLYEMGLVPFKVFLDAKKYGKSTPIHIVGFYRKIAGFERFLVNIAHHCGNKVIYELRNGSMITSYLNGNNKYRDILQDLLLKPEIVLCQGLEYVDFIKEKWGIERCYYPNYIMDDFVASNNLFRPEPIRLIYFGRVTPAKNVDIIIKTLINLRSSGMDAELEIVGGYSDAYKRILDEIVSNGDVGKYVTFYGRKPFGFIAERLKKSHYFVFPSTEEQEGHSNSLTEAMGCGVVPIVSTAGFNVSICGNKELVVDKVEAERFAQRIIDIEKTGKWKDYSSFVYNRIQSNFTQKVVSEHFISYIETLF